MLSTWIKSITGHNNLANLNLIQKLTPHPDYAYKLMKPFIVRPLPHFK